MRTVASDDVVHTLTRWRVEVPGLMAVANNFISLSEWTNKYLKWRAKVVKGLLY